MNIETALKALSDAISLMGRYRRGPGAGTLRRREREAAHRAAIKERLAASPEPVVPSSRQVRRRIAIVASKHARSLVKLNKRRAKKPRRTPPPAQAGEQGALAATGLTP